MQGIYHPKEGTSLITGESQDDLASSGALRVKKRKACSCKLGETHVFTSCFLLRDERGDPFNSPYTIPGCGTRIRSPLKHHPFNSGEGSWLVGDISFYFRKSLRGLLCLHMSFESSEAVNQGLWPKIRVPLRCGLANLTAFRGYERSGC